MERHEVCPVSDLARSGQGLAELDGRSIDVFNVEKFYELKNVCLHHLSPLCEETITRTVTPLESIGEYDWKRERERERERKRVIRCPWYKWELDITTGESVYNPLASARKRTRRRWNHRRPVRQLTTRVPGTQTPTLGLVQRRTVTGPKYSATNRRSRRLRRVSNGTWSWSRSDSFGPTTAAFGRIV